jgi:hypothetical protein
MYWYNNKIIIKGIQSEHKLYIRYYVYNMISNLINWFKDTGELVNLYLFNVFIYWNNVMSEKVCAIIFKEGWQKKTCNIAFYLFICLFRICTSI